MLLPKNKIVVKHNSLIDASYHLSLVEQRVMLLAIVTAREICDLTPSTNIEVSAKDYISQYKVSNATAYETIKEAADSLFNRQFSYHNDYKNSNAITKARWVNKIIYAKDLGLIVLNLSDEVISLISRLEVQFTRYMLDQVSDFKSKYSVRVYELIIKWLKVGRTEKYELKDFRNKIGLLEKEYSSLGDFKKRVLDVAVKEINEKTDISIDLEQFKTGRSVTHIRFNIKCKLKKPVLESKNKVKNHKLTEDQIYMFSNKLSNDKKFQLHFPAYVGEDMNSYRIRIEKKLNDEFYVLEWFDFLIDNGFKAKTFEV